MSQTEGPLTPFYSVPKVAELFDVKPDTVRDWITQGKIEAIKINGRWKISRDEVKRFGSAKFGA